MAALPKKKISRVRGRTRRGGHKRPILPQLVICNQCQTAKLPHTICPKCGHYGKIKIIKTKLDKIISKTLDKPVSKTAKKSDN